MIASAESAQARAIAVQRRFLPPQCNRNVSDEWISHHDEPLYLRHADMRITLAITLAITLVRPLSDGQPGMPA
jgi:hypothetical protein